MDQPSGNPSDGPPGPGWWLASDGQYYPPEASPSSQSPARFSSDPSGPDVAHSGVTPKDQKRAERDRIKEQKRADRAAAKEQQEAELARLKQETAGKQLGFRVFKDGTVEKESSSSSPGSAWLQDKLGQSGLLGPSMNPRHRSAVLDATLDDKRIRKPFARVRDATGHATGGLLGGGKDHFGSASLTIATNDWVEVVEARTEKDLAALDALHALLREAMGAPASMDGPVPDPPQPPSTATVTDVPAALRDLKALHEEGLLTDEEYEARRQVLIARL